MHEWPLVIFTALVIPTAGLFAARLLCEIAGLAAPATPFRGPTTIAAVALAAALAVSLAHLGRPFRAPRALARTGRNALSTEIALSLALFVLVLLTLLRPLSSTALDAVALTSGAVAAALLVTLGVVYFLRARWPWRSTLAATPLLTGLAMGIVVLSPELKLGAYVDVLSVVERNLGAYLLVLLVTDALLYAYAWLRPTDARHAGPSAGGACAALPVYPAIFEHRHALVALRLALVNVMPIALAIAGRPHIAAASMVAGVLVDRFTFYGAAAHCSAEAEIARVESLIAKAQP